MIRVNFLPLRDRKEKKMLIGKWVVKISVKQGDPKKLFRVMSSKEMYFRENGKMAAAMDDIPSDIRLMPTPTEAAIARAPAAAAP